MTVRRLTRGASLGAALVLGAGSLAGVAGAASVARAGSTTTVTGTVVATSSVRDTIVVVDRGALATLRVSRAAARSLRPGERVVARVRALADGTDATTSLRTAGRGGRVSFRAVVAARTAGGVVVSGGGSSVLVRTGGRRAHDGATTGTVGSVVSVSADLGGNGLTATSLSSTGASGVVELEGLVTGLANGTLSLTLEGGAPVTVSVGTVTLPTTLATGQWVEAITSYSNGAYSLLALQVDGASAGQSGLGLTQAGTSATVRLEGVVVAASPTSITVQPGDGAAPVVVAIPATPTTPVPTVSVGDHVHAIVTYAAPTTSGTPAPGTTSTPSATLVSLWVEGGAPPNVVTEVEGVVVAYQGGVLMIQPNESPVATPVSITVGATGPVLPTTIVGARVHARATMVNGVLTLVSLRVQSPEGDHNGQGNNGQGNNGQGTYGQGGSGSVGVTAPVVHLDGTVAAVVAPTTVGGAVSLTLLPGDNAPAATVSVPASALGTLTLAVGMHVSITATSTGGALVATSVTLSN